MSALKIPDAPNSIQKGVPLKLLLDKAAITQLGENLQHVYNAFDKTAFAKHALKGIDDHTIVQRANKIAESLHAYLPSNYSVAVNILLESLTAPLEKTEDNGLASMFYMPHASFIGKYGVDKAYNDGEDPFEISMNAQYELTKRFTAEFSIRHFIIQDSERTFEYLYKWMNDPDPHVRRLASEGSRPRLPWSMKIASLAKDPSPSIPILELLKDDDNLYVRRSVANHVGDIAKDNLDIALSLCDDWLKDASKELKWVIRHALRHPDKKGIEAATALRKAAK